MEALVLVFILLLALGVYAFARRPVRGQPRSARAEMMELRRQLTRHEESLRRAREQNSNREMIHQLSEQLDDTRFQLAQVAARTAK